MKQLAQSFMANRAAKEAELRAMYAVPPPKLVELEVLCQPVQFQLGAQLAEQNYQTQALTRVALPVEAGLSDISTFPWIDDEALLNARLTCDGQPVTLLRVVFDNLSSDSGPAHGFVLLEGDHGTLNLSIMRVDENPSNFIVTTATWYCPFPQLITLEKKSYL